MSRQTKCSLIITLQPQKQYTCTEVGPWMTVSPLNYSNDLGLFATPAYSPSWPICEIDIKTVVYTKVIALVAVL